MSDKIPSKGAEAGGKSAAGGIGAWWRHVTKGEGGQAVTKKISTVASSVRDRASKMKWSMPVDVKVDFLQPTVQTVKSALDAAWHQLPPPAQQAAPYVGVALGSGLLVHLIQQRRVNYYKRKRDEMFNRVRSLERDKENLTYKIGVLKSGGAIPRSETEIRMAAAIAEATNAAAAAADAAAKAATSCIVHRTSQSIPR